MTAAAPPDLSAQAVADLDFDAILAQIAEDVHPLLDKGHVADYIPRLAEVELEQFGMVVVTVDGKHYEIGDTQVPFSAQSTTKVHALAMALDAVGTNLWQRVGREPSGNPFNSLVQLEREGGIPRNPMINSGALVVADVVVSASDDPLKELLDFVRSRSGNAEVSVDGEVMLSEREAGYRNAALVNFLASFGNIDNDVHDVLDFYFQQCALRMTCADLARSFLYLAHAGTCPVSGEQVMNRIRAKRVNAIMLTSGTYDAAGDFAFKVGLPVKSGVGGAMVAIVPGVGTAATWSPGLDHHGNSLAGGVALSRFTELTGLSIF